MTEVQWDPQAETRCVHVDQCGACPLMPKSYADQRAHKLRLVERALARYQRGASQLFEGGKLADIDPAEPISRYRRRAKLVVMRDASGQVAVGLYRRNDNQSVVDISECQVLSPGLMALAAAIRELAAEPPDELRCLLEAAGPAGGVLAGLDARELYCARSAEARPAEAPPTGDGGFTGDGGAEASVLLTLILVAERAAPVDELRQAARELRRRMPAVAGVAVNLRYGARSQQSSELVPLSGATECRDALRSGYQLVSHTSFLHVHRAQAARLYGLLEAVVAGISGGEPLAVLDLYGGTGAIALSLAGAGHRATMVESYPPAASLALRAAQAQRLAVEVVTGDVASVSKALAVAGSRFDLVIANPPRRGLSPAARESIAALGPKSVVYVACDLDNLSRDVDHLSRLGYRLRDLYPLDMLPLTEEIEVVALLERAAVPPPRLLFQDDDIVALDKAPHEPVDDQPEYPGSLVGRARGAIDGGEWIGVLQVGAGTSGVCLFARSQETAAEWREALSDTGRLIYLAAARGVTPAKGAITRELRGEDGARPARTRYRRLAIGGGHSILRVVPERRHVHQIRRHLAAIGHPVLGDARYGHAPTNRYFEEKHGLDRSFLHLVRVEVDHPKSGDRLLIEAPLPPDLRGALVRASDESVLRFLSNKRALGGAGAELRPRHQAPPASEQSPLSMIEPEPDSAYPSQRVSEVGSAPFSVRGGRQPLELDEAPRTVRGELLTPDDDD